MALQLVFGAAVTILIGAAAVVVLLPETWHGNAGGEGRRRRKSFTALGAALRDRRLAALLLSISVLEIAVSWIEAVTPLYATAAGTVTPTGVPKTPFAYAGVIGVIFELPVTQVSARFSGFATVLCSGAIEALAFVFLLPAPALPLLIAAITFCSSPHAVGTAGPGHRVRTGAAQRAGHLSGGVLDRVRYERCRRAGDRDVAL